MTHIEQMIQDMCPNGVEFKTLGELTRTLPKGTLKTSDLIEEGYGDMIVKVNDKNYKNLVW